MSFFSKLFVRKDGNTTRIQATIRAEINISDAIAAHMKWKGRLQSYLDGTSDEKLDPMVICRDDQCVLGKWIHGPALSYFGDNEGFHKLRSDHANFHLVAGNVVTKVQQNDRAGADMMMNNDYAHASHNVIYGLSDLNKHLNDE